MEKKAEVTVNVDLKPHDVYTPFRWERNNVIRWVVAGLLCLIFRDLYASSAETLDGFPGAGSIRALMFVLAIFVLLALLLFPYLRVRALFRGTKQLGEPHQITFRPEGIFFKSERATSDCRWTVFTRVYETRKVFAFAHGTAGGTYVPKRCFANTDDITALRAIIKENFKGKWTLRRD